MQISLPCDLKIITNMKKLFFIAAAGLIIAAVGCKGGGTPKEVTERFFKAMNKKDFDAAKDEATKESAQMLDLMKTFAAADTSKAKAKDFTVENEKIDGDKATVDVKETESGKTQNVTLKKVDGKWKVAFDKSSMGGGSNHTSTAPATTTPSMSDSSTMQPATNMPADNKMMNNASDSMMKK